MLFMVSDSLLVRENVIFKKLMKSQLRVAARCLPYIQTKIINLRNAQDKILTTIQDVKSLKSTIEKSFAFECGKSLKLVFFWNCK